MKNIIWSSKMFQDDEARKEYEELRKEFCGNDYVVTEQEWWDAVENYLDDEKINLDEEIDGVIIAFANLGLWNGRRQGYKILGSNVQNIFDVSEDYNEWYGDGNNIRGTLSHHDGEHYVLYRIAKDYETAQRIAEQIYNRDIDEAGFRKRTRSLYPFVADIYGWKCNKFHKKREKCEETTR